MLRYEACEQAKFKKLPVDDSSNPKSKSHPLQHSDIVGLINVQSLEDNDQFHIYVKVVVTNTKSALYKSVKRQCLKVAGIECEPRII